MNTALLKDAAQRAANTAWQSLVTLTGAGQVDLFSLSWTHIGEVALGSAVLSFIKTLGVAGALSNPAATTPVPAPVAAAPTETPEPPAGS